MIHFSAHVCPIVLAPSLQRRTLSPLRKKAESQHRQAISSALTPSLEMASEPTGEGLGRPRSLGLSLGPRKTAPDLSSSWARCPPIGSASVSGHSAGPQSLFEFSTVSHGPQQPSSALNAAQPQVINFPKIRKLCMDLSVAHQRPLALVPVMCGPRQFFFLWPRDARSSDAPDLGSHSGWVSCKTAGGTPGPPGRKDSGLIPHQAPVPSPCPQPLSPDTDLRRHTHNTARTQTHTRLQAQAHPALTRPRTHTFKHAELQTKRGRPLPASWTATADVPVHTHPPFSEHTATHPNARAANTFARHASTWARGLLTGPAHPEAAQLRGVTAPHQRAGRRGRRPHGLGEQQGSCLPPSGAPGCHWCFATRLPLG